MSRLLVIDDEFLVLKSIAMTLEAFGHSVVTASSTREALERLAQGEEPEAVIADYRLRDGDTGLIAIAAIRGALGEKIPAMILTGDTAPDRISEIHGSGVRVLHKPVSVHDLLGALDRLLQDPPRRHGGHEAHGSFLVRP